jgi:hypothetical protein
MRYFLALFATIILSGSAVSQTYEIGPLVGGTNFIGDVGRTNYVYPNSLGFGALFKWNRSPRHSFRFSVMYSQIKADDADSDDARRQQRGLFFEEDLLEFSLGLEYTFWEFDLHTAEPQGTPYLYTGIVYFEYEALRRLPDRKKLRGYDSAWSPAIPIILGYKMTVGTNVILAGEIGVRYTFTDGLDGSYPVKQLSDREDLRFGNVNNNDWYVHSGITLTFAFGRRPCYCNF